MASADEMHMLDMLNERCTAAHIQHTRTILSLAREFIPECISIDLDERYGDISIRWAEIWCFIGTDGNVNIINERGDVVISAINIPPQHKAAKIVKAYYAAQRSS